MNNAQCSMNNAVRFRGCRLGATRSIKPWEILPYRGESCEPRAECQACLTYAEAMPIRCEAKRGSQRRRGRSLPRRCRLGAKQNLSQGDCEVENSMSFICIRNLSYRLVVKRRGLMFSDIHPQRRKRSSPVRFRNSIVELPFINENPAEMLASFRKE